MSFEAPKRLSFIFSASEKQMSFEAPKRLSFIFSASEKQMSFEAPKRLSFIAERDMRAAKRMFFICWVLECIFSNCKLEHQY